jgi:hypothetical protein
MTTNSSDSGNQEDREASDEDVDSEIAEAVTDKGQPLALNERLDTGSKSWGDVQKDKYQYSSQSAFPACTSARTSFYARQARNPQLYNRLFPLQHGGGHTYEGWDGQRIRPKDREDYRRSHAILSQVDVTDPVKKWTVEKVMQENLTGFSRYYEGLDGAALGFATLYECDDEEMAKDSYLVDAAEEMLGIDGEMLVEYVWDNYGGDV